MRLNKNLDKKLELADFKPYVVLKREGTNGKGNTTLFINCLECGGHNKAEISQTADNEILYYCHKCNASNGRNANEPATNFNQLYKDILASNAITPNQPQPKDNNRQEHETTEKTFKQAFKYYDFDGHISFYKDKFVDAEGHKSFYYRHYDRQGNKIKGLPAEHVHLYNLNNLLKLQDKSILFLVEGEKDVDSLQAVGIPATSMKPVSRQPLTAKETNFLNSFGKIVMIPDNDSIGADVATKFSLYINPAKLFLLDIVDIWENCPTKADISDYLQLAETIEHCSFLGYDCLGHLLELKAKPYKEAIEAKPQQKTIEAENSQQKAIEAEPQQKAIEAENKQQNKNILPKYFTYISQAEVFTQKYRKDLIYTSATSWLKYEHLTEGGGYWRIKADKEALALYQEFTNLQIQLADTEGIQDYISEVVFPNITDDKELDKATKAYFRSMRAMQNASYKVLAEAEAMLLLDSCLLDSDAYVLNTPKGIIDLHTGDYLTQAQAKNHYCTHITAYSPSMQGADIWQNFINDFTCNDADLAEYLQELAGEMVVGEVKEEHLIIAYNQRGRNGKSTFFNSLATALNTYAEHLPSKLITRNGKYSNKDIYAVELQGKRLVLLKELGVNERLAENELKDLFSTDSIKGCRKFCDPVTFKPSHTGVLYTNNLPAIMSDDGGTKRRLQVIPCNAYFPKETAIENYADYMAEHAGGYIIKWCIEGAKKFIANNYKIKPPKAVLDATADYIAEYDRLLEFINECCYVGEGAKILAGDLYTRYGNWCMEQRTTFRASITTLNRRDFKSRMEEKGFILKRVTKGIEWQGIGLLDNEF